MNKNIVIIHYNTPHLTECLVRSINLFVNDAIIYIFDNSDKDPFTAKFDNVCLLDNTNGEIINFEEWLENYPDRIKSSAIKNNYASAKHCYSVQKCIELLDEPFILLDSDVLLKRDISDLYDENYAFIGNIEYWKAANTISGNLAVKKPRAIPYLCFINTNICKENNIEYYNEDFIYGLTSNGDSYDTGTYFFEQILNFKLPWKKINLNDNIVHYKAGSWLESARKYDNYKKMSIDNWLEINESYWLDNHNDKVVYTCITNDYDTLLEPTYVSSGFDYICFTDNPNLTSNIWKIKSLPNEVNELSQIKKQRYIKINADKVVGKYDLSIWVDGNVSLIGDLNELLEQTLEDDCSIYIPNHPQRNCIYDEANMVIRIKKDTKENVLSQINGYEGEGFPKNYGLVQSNIIIRKHNNKDCIKIMESWFNELRDKSHRDQLSFNYVLWKNQDVKVEYLDKNIYKSKWFKWNCIHSKPKSKIVKKTLKTSNIRLY